VDSLHAELELAHQESFQFSRLEKRKQNLELRSMKLTYPDVEPSEIIEVTRLPDPDTSTWTLDALAADLSAEKAEDDEYGLYPCKWKTGASAIDQCQLAFDCREVSSNLYINLVGCSARVGFGSAHARLSLSPSTRGDCLSRLSNDTGPSFSLNIGGIYHPII
jgi:hypothetical protein